MSQRGIAFSLSAPPSRRQASADKVVCIPLVGSRDATSPATCSMSRRLGKRAAVHPRIAPWPMSLRTPGMQRLVRMSSPRTSTPMPERNRRRSVSGLAIHHDGVILAEILRTGSFPEPVHPTDRRSYAAITPPSRSAAFTSREGPVEPGEQRLDVRGLHRRAAPDAQPGRGVAVSGDVVGDAFLFQAGRRGSWRRRPARRRTAA